jgi:hypothetical protein
MAPMDEPCSECTHTECACDCDVCEERRIELGEDYKGPLCMCLACRSYRKRVADDIAATREAD